MNWFGSKMSEEAGQWAATAMACVVFADGNANEAEIAAARGQVTTNPVLRDSIGTKEAERLFKETADAIAQIPAAMLPTYEIKLQGLAKSIREVNDKNFAFTTVIAVAMGDKTLTPAEHQMLVRFREMLGAGAIPIPDAGAPASGDVRDLQNRWSQARAEGPNTAGPMSARQPGVAGQPAQQQAYAQQQGYPQQPQQAYPQQPQQAYPQQPQQAYPQQPQQAYPQQPQQAYPQRASVPNPPPASGPVSTANLGACPRCGSALVPYPGYGPYCQTCRQVVTRG
ncbi:MAG: TerB family tellurite resistance protein [Polyangiaceae bacterium]